MNQRQHGAHRNGDSDSAGAMTVSDESPSQILNPESDEVRMLLEELPKQAKREGVPPRWLE